MCTLQMGKHDKEHMHTHLSSIPFRPLYLVNSQTNGNKMYVYVRTCTYVYAYNYTRMYVHTSLDSECT